MNRLNDWKRKFLNRILDVRTQVQQFKLNDRMSEAEQYVVQLENISKSLDDFNTEVSDGVCASMVGYASDWLMSHLYLWL